MATPQFSGAAQGRNFPTSQAATDLGLGDALVQQMQDQDEERKKKLLQQGTTPSTLGVNGDMQSPAAQALLGQGGLGGKY